MAFVGFGRIIVFFRVKNHKTPQEQHPKGHKAPVKRELIKLGAISPQKLQMQKKGSCFPFKGDEGV